MALLFIRTNKESAVNELTGEAIKETSKPIGDISYQQAQKDATINAIIDSSQLMGHGN